MLWFWEYVEDILTRWMACGVVKGGLAKLSLEVVDLLLVFWRAEGVGVRTEAYDRAWMIR